MDARRPAYMLLSGLLAIALVLAASQWGSAQRAGARFIDRHLLLFRPGDGLQALRQGLPPLPFPSRLPSRGQQPKQGAGALQQKQQQQQCAIYNNVVYHMDVAAGFAWAFQEAGCRVTCYLRKDPSSMQASRRPPYLQEVMAGWYHGDFRAAVTLPRDAERYAVIVMVTFPEFGARLALQQALLEGTGPGGSEPTKAIQQQQQQGPGIQAVALAPNVARYTRSLLESWAAGQLAATPHVDVPWLPPLVPWQLSPATATRGSYRHLCIQGTISARRRDYAAAFAAASHPTVLVQLRRHNESLLVVGSLDPKGVPPPVPMVLQDLVRFAMDLTYEDYYATLARCRAILTAFPTDSDAYLVKKSSSTVAAAIHVGTPLVTEEKALLAYSYLRREAAFAYDPTPGAATPDPVTEAAAAAAAALEASAAASDLQRREKLPPAAATLLQKVEFIDSSGSAGAAVGTGEPQHLQQQRDRPPEPGSYAAALLRTFEPGAAAAAHHAARSLKAELMRHNAEVARLFLGGATAPMSAPAAAAQLGAVQGR